MNYYLVCAGSLIALMGLSHSYYGEKKILIPLFLKDGLPPLMGNREMARLIVRFTWHLSTLFMLGIAAILFHYATIPRAEIHDQVLEILRITFSACFLLILFGIRGRYLSWVPFLLISLFLWFG